jgi:mRNA interferase MazF
MLPMTTYSFGDVLLVPFLFTDRTASKKRPAIVISSNDYNSARPDLIVIGVSSQINSPLLYGEMEIQDWQSAGLLKISVVKSVITTIEKGLVIRQLGNLQTSDRESLENLVRFILKQ